MLDDFHRRRVDELLAEAERYGIHLEPYHQEVLERIAADLTAVPQRSECPTGTDPMFYEAALRSLLRAGVVLRVPGRYYHYILAFPSVVHS